MANQQSTEASSSAYDVVVIGAGMGGLTSAALLARAGKKVVVIEQEAAAGGCVRGLRRDGYTFDRAVHLITQCSNTPALGRGIVDVVLRELGVRDRCEFLPVAAPFYTVKMPGGDVAIPTGEQAYVDALVRAFPRDEVGIRRLVALCMHIAAENRTFPHDPRFRDLLLAPWHAPTMFRYRNATLGEVVAGELRDPRARAAYAALAHWIGSNIDRDSFLAWANMISQYVLDGAYYVRGGFQVLADAMVEGVVRAGGEVVCNTRVAKIDTDNRRVRGVALDSGQYIRAPVVISNIDPRATLERLVDRPSDVASLARKVRSMEMSISVGALYLATDLDPRAFGLSHDNVYTTILDAHELVARTNACDVAGLSITIPTMTDPSLAPSGQHIVMLMAVLPETMVVVDYAERMLARAEDVLPGLRSHITASIGGDTGVALHLFAPMYGASMTPEQMGYGRLPHGTPIHGLELVGQWTRPGAGVPWSVESGVQVATRVLGRSPFAAPASTRAPDLRTIGAHS